MEGAVAAAPGEEMAVQEAMVPAGTQTPGPGGRGPSRKKKRAMDFFGVPTVTTRSMQKQKSLAPCKSIETLPSISGALVRAIASCESDRGFSFAELKEVLSTKGYSASRHCPNVKKRLHSLVSRGALVRMTRGNGSTFFVVRKYLESDHKTFGSSKKIAGIKKSGAEQSTLRASENVQGEAKQGRSSRRKTGDARGKKLRPGETQPKQPTSKGHSAKRLQTLRKRAVSAAKGSVSAGSHAVPKAKRPQHSSGRAASATERARSTKGRGASSSKTAGRPAGKTTSKSSRCPSSHVLPSATGQGSPYSSERLNAKKTGCGKGKKAAAGRGHSGTRGKAAFPQQRLKASASSSTKRPSGS